MHSDTLECLCVNVCGYMLPHPHTHEAQNYYYYCCCCRLDDDESVTRSEHNMLIISDSIKLLNIYYACLNFMSFMLITMVLCLRRRRRLPCERCSRSSSNMLTAHSTHTSAHLWHSAACEQFPPARNRNVKH
jgi:hypothetical protein